MHTLHLLIWLDVQRTLGGKLTINWAASAAVGYGFSMLLTIHWLRNSKRGF